MNGGVKPFTNILDYATISLMKQTTHIDNKVVGSIHVYFEYNT